jgi:hypothetical protein
MWMSVFAFECVDPFSGKSLIEAANEKTRAETMRGARTGRPVLLRETLPK